MKLLIVIVNYRTAALVVDCLRSLEPEVRSSPGVTVVVTDNASGDGGAEQIRREIESQGWSAWASAMPLERNGGFSFGNNAAIRPALAGASPPDAVMLLNPDTIVRPGAIGVVLRFLAAHPGAGIAGSRIEDPDGTRQACAHLLPTPLTELDSAARLGPLTRLLGRHSLTMPVPPGEYRCEWVSGACMTVRREVFEQIGLLDEGYFLYFDEVDFCRRAVQAGWEVWHVPDSRIIHLEGAATGITQARKRRGRWWYDSRRRFYVKAYGVRGLIAADLLWASGRVLSFMRRLVSRRPRPSGDPLRFASDLLWGDLRALVSGKAWSIDRDARPT